MFMSYYGKLAYATVCFMVCTMHAMERQLAAEITVWLADGSQVNLWPVYSQLSEKVVSCTGEIFNRGEDNSTPITRGYAMDLYHAFLDLIQKQQK
jgi:hypothetical protein